MKHLILDTDWWTDCDDAVAIRLLCRAHQAGEIRLDGVVIDACMSDSVPSMDAFFRYEKIELPIGLDREATDFGGRPSYQARLAGSPLALRRNEDAENGVSLYRRLLAEAEEPVEILSIGFPNVLAALLESKPDAFSPFDGAALVRKKVKRLWMMAGKWDENPGKENNFARNARSRVASAKVLAGWQTPVTFLGFEVGASVKTGGILSPEDPLGQVLRDHGSANGRSSWDPMTALLAVIGDENAAGYRVVRGTASVDPETGLNSFVENENGMHAYVVKRYDDAYYADEINRRIR